MTEFLIIISMTLMAYWALKWAIEYDPMQSLREDLVGRMFNNSRSRDEQDEEDIDNDELGNIVLTGI